MRTFLPEKACENEGAHYTQVYYFAVS